MIGGPINQFCFDIYGLNNLRSVDEHDLGSWDDHLQEGRFGRLNSTALLDFELPGVRFSHAGALSGSNKDARNGFHMPI